MSTSKIQQLAQEHGFEAVGDNDFKMTDKATGTVTYIWYRSPGVAANIGLNRNDFADFYETGFWDAVSFKNGDEGLRREHDFIYGANEKEAARMLPEVAQHHNKVVAEKLKKPRRSRKVSLPYYD